MLENVMGAISRIDEIKSQFRTARVGGEVTIAPHAGNAPGTSPAAVKPFFPSYLLNAAKQKVMGSTEIASAYDDLIQASATKWKIDPALLKGLIQAESGFNTNAVSAAGAKGLCQLMPATAQGLGVSDPFDPAQSIEGGARYLRCQMDRFGDDESLALAAYNAGPGRVVKYGGVPPFRETQNYVNKVLSYRDSYR